MKNKWNKTTVVLAALIGCAGVQPAISPAAQNSIDITGESYNAIGNTPPIWVSLSGFTGEADQVLRFDLYVQGFNFTNAENAQYIISGSNNGNLQGKVTDRFNKSAVLPPKGYTGAPIRRQAHFFADDFVQAIGRKGIAKTKVAFAVEKSGNAEIYVADFDGHNSKVATQDSSLVSSPNWVPGRFSLFYSTYKLGNPAIYSHDLSTGSRVRVAWYGGSNLSPAPSANGKVAMILSKDGWADLYVASADGKNLKRLTRSKEEESAPCWSPDGQWICFASKIAGRRSLCKVPASGGPVERIPTSGIPNPTEPEWSPDGKWIAFTAQGGGFDICVMSSNGGDAKKLVAGEDPSWSPNSRTLIFSRRSTGRLALLDVFTKQNRDIARVSSGINSQPSWAK